jgi:hypothetical protein
VILSSLGTQVVRQPLAIGQKLIDLVVTMDRVYFFVDAIRSDATEKVKVLEDTIRRIFIQTVECGIFIREYANRGFVGNYAEYQSAYLFNDIIFRRQSTS